MSAENHFWTVGCVLRFCFDCSCPALRVWFGQSTYRVPETAGNVTVCANIGSFLDRDVNLTIRTCISDDTATEEGRVEREERRSVRGRVTPKMIQL